MISLYILFIGIFVCFLSPNFSCSKNYFRLVFEFPPTGGVITSHHFHTIKLLRYLTVFDHVILGLEFVHLAFIIFYILEEIREILYLKWSYLKLFWSYVDITIIVVSLARKVQLTLRSILKNFRHLCRTTC